MHVVTNKNNPHSVQVWMSAFYRLHLDEAAERLKRETLLKQRLMHLRSTGLVQVSAEAEAQMQQELVRLNSLAWQRRAINFKNADLFSSPPPLMHLRVDNLSGLFMPRPATWLENKTADMDLSGLSKGSALWPEFDMLVGGEVSRIVISGVSMRIRDYVEPLFTIKTVEVCGTEDQCVGGTSAVSNTDEGGGRENHHHSNGSQPEEKDAEHGNKKGVGSDATLPPGWRKRGCVIMSEERLPVAAKALRVAVHQVHAAGSVANCFCNVCFVLSPISCNHIRCHLRFVLSRNFTRTPPLSSFPGHQRRPNCGQNSMCSLTSQRGVTDRRWDQPSTSSLWSWQGCLRHRLTLLESLSPLHSCRGTKHG